MPADVGTKKKSPASFPDIFMVLKSGSWRNPTASDLSKTTGLSWLNSCGPGHDLLVGPENVDKSTRKDGVARATVIQNWVSCPQRKSLACCCG